MRKLPKDAFEARYWPMKPIPYYLNVWLFKTHHICGRGRYSSVQKVPSGVTLRMIVSGDWSMEMRGRRRRMSPGEMFCTMPSEPVEFRQLDEGAAWEWREMQFYGPEAERFLGEFGLSRERPSVRPRDPKRALKLFKETHMRMGEPGRSAPAMLATVFELVEACGRRRAESARRDPARGMVEVAKLQLQGSGFFVDVSVKELAARMGVERSTLYRAFKGETGLSPHEYIDHLRLVRAQELLGGTALPVSEVARQTGFSSAKYFIGWFKSKTGASPGAWRSRR